MFKRLRSIRVSWQVALASGTGLLIAGAILLGPRNLAAQNGCFESQSDASFAAGTAVGQQTINEGQTNEVGTVVYADAQQSTEHSTCYTFGPLHDAQSGEEITNILRGDVDSLYNQGNLPLEYVHSHNDDDGGRVPGLSPGDVLVAHEDGLDITAVDPYEADTSNMSRWHYEDSTVNDSYTIFTPSGSPIICDEEFGDSCKGPAEQYDPNHPPNDRCSGDFTVLPECDGDPDDGY